ncbi:MAG: M15 family metallopeptidase [Lachnospiraceae bacterium]|nr:M15 family metallopeptidase [Lachnospiraceae bacterium]
MGNDILSKRLEWRRREERKKKLLTGVFAALVVVLVLVLIWAGTEVRKIRKNAQAAGNDPAAVTAESETAESGAETAQAEESGVVMGTESAVPADDSAWMLILVNKNHPIPDGYTVPEFTELRNGHRVDSRIYPDLQNMFDDMRSEGLKPGITSSFRSHEDQQSMMDKKIKEYEDAGNSHEEAVRLAEEWVAIPGTSEHELGLSVDISSADKEAQSPDRIWSWLNENCWEYGFIQRYPENKTDITGIIDEPWHYRYVGKAAAKEMTEQGLVLEEYLGMTE